MLVFNPSLVQNYIKWKPLSCQLCNTNKLDVAIIYAEFNDVRNRKFSSEQIVRGIIQKGNIFKDRQVNSSFNSSLACRNSSQSNRKVKSINVIWERLCQSNRFIFINSSNITKMDLGDDGLHLRESGKCILPDNFLNSLNRFYELRKLVIVITDFEIKI